MSRYIVMAMRIVPLDGPQPMIRMPRVTRWTHPLWKYCNDNDVVAIQKLFSEGKASPHDVNPHGSSALIYAAGHNDLQLSQFLLRESADPDLANDWGRSPAELLWERSFAGHLSSEDNCRMGIMLKDHENVETWRFSRIHKIVLGLVYQDLRSELEVSTACINMGDSWGRTPLCWATIRNDVECAKVLLSFGADPNITDESGQTSLFFVQTPEMCETLLQAGVDVHVRNSGQKSALHQFCRGIVRRDTDNNYVDVIDMLIKADIDVNVCDENGETPLMNAIHAGLLGYARRLIENGADVNAANYGWGNDNAIQFAVRWDQPDIIPLLLEKGADYTALNYAGRNIAHFACQSGSAKTIAVLAASNLNKLDVTVRDKDGLTPADYLAQRTICVDTEDGLHEEYLKLLQTLPPKPRTPRRTGIWPSLDVEAQIDLEDCLVPGAFPEYDDKTNLLII